VKEAGDVMDAVAREGEDDHAADAYRDFMGPFVRILLSTDLIAAFGDAPGAACVTVRDGEITYSRFLFDRAPVPGSPRGGR